MPRRLTAERKRPSRTGKAEKKGLTEMENHLTYAVKDDAIKIADDGTIEIISNGETDDLKKLISGDYSSYSRIYNLLPSILKNTADQNFLASVPLNFTGANRAKGLALQILYRKGEINGPRLGFIIDKFNGNNSKFDILKDKVPTTGNSDTQMRQAIVNFIDYRGLTPFNMSVLLRKKNVDVDFFPYITLNQATRKYSVDIRTMDEATVHKVFKAVEAYALSGYDGEQLNQLARLYSG